ncbi:MAG TPA: multifunctional CCA tRNA nucleotidyl transferase/2'3'-cyclic phosphodiesterase/2'nucleotidase/phosphatase [Steroidobacteraceae bacterium]|jgi:tRNA nucleotidyltransferase (CCA-adding enzyme)|nr:multifunctional CCA tRNA nucleotidyl transferase/2'3'-cyclic phosphodiesterase/2'nucleotidase/phosphatase [Steroidobacteraceae bacterium]
MQVYLVGGAVRDELLGRPVHERDWVVVGATPEQMQQAGYRPVGREFPVFLHPQTHEEYALARRERKTGPGYRGFVTEFSPSVTLEQDLLRRDLTINAIARDSNGTLIDPYGGVSDLEQRLLRHVSPAFVEDPVRILRVARLRARLASLGFQVAEETGALMHEMVRNGEVNALVPERVWRETERALGEANPEVFFDILARCDALYVLFPGLSWSDDDRLALARAAALSQDGSVRFAALGAVVPAKALAALCDRLRAPAAYRDVARLCAQLTAQSRAGLGNDPASTLLRLFEQADAFRRRERFEKVLLAAQARAKVDSRIPAALSAVAEVALAPDQMAAMHGADIASALHAARLERLRSFCG